MRKLTSLSTLALTHDASETPEWYVTHSIGGPVLGVFGSALFEMASADAKRAQVKTGIQICVSRVRGRKPVIGLAVPPNAEIMQSAGMRVQL